MFAVHRPFELLWLTYGAGLSLPRECVPVECRDSDVEHVDSDNEHDASKDTGKRLFLCAQ